MLDFLERMRQKPESVRARFVFAVSTGITAVIFLIWLSVIGSRFTGPEPDLRRNIDPAEQSANDAVESALEKSRAEYEAFQRELQKASGVASTTSVDSATTTPQ